MLTTFKKPIRLRNFKKYCSIVLLVKMILLIFMVSVTATPITLSDDKNSLKLGALGSFFWDKDHVLTITDISKESFQDNFFSQPNPLPAFGYRNAILWFRVELVNTRSQNVLRYLEIDYPTLDHVELYQKDLNGNWIIKQAGDNIPFNKGREQIASIVFKLEIPANSRQTVFVKTLTKASYVFPVLLHNYEGYLDKTRATYLINGAFAGILGVMFFYNVLVFAGNRDKSYFYYIAFILGLSLYAFTLKGIANMYIWEPLGIFSDRGLSITITFMVLPAILFTQKFLELKYQAPLLNRITQVFVVAMILYAIVTQIQPGYTGFLAAVIVFLAAPFLFITGIICIKRGFKPAVFYFVSIFGTLISTIIISLRSAGLVQEGFWVSNAVYIGTAWHMIGLALALSFRYRILRKEKEQFQAKAIELEVVAKQELERKVRERTSELDLARKEAESANRAKSTFLANMSHEIRTPMHAILGFADLMQLKTRDFNPESSLSQIQKAGKTLLSLIDNILDISKIESGKFDLESKPTDLHQLIKDVHVLFQNKAIEQKDRFSYRISDNVPKYVLIDNTRLKQILFNLCSNAIKFTKGGEILLEVDIKGADSETCIVVFSVSDTGIGIEDNQKERIFKPFEQQKGQDFEEYGGTGLGLSISKKLSLLMGGDVHVIDNQPTGSIFIVELPVIPTEETDFPDSRNSKDPQSDPIFEKTDLLIADDIYSNRLLLREYLKNTGLTLHEAKDGEEALEKIKSIKPGLVIMDNKMPGLSGNKVAQQVRSNPEIKDIPMVVVSASAMEEDRKRFLETFDVFLRKPVNRNQIFEVLKQFIPLASSIE